MKVSESEDMEEAAAAIHRDDVQLCRRLGEVFENSDYFDWGDNIHIVLITITSGRRESVERGSDDNLQHWRSCHGRARHCSWHGEQL